MARAVVLGGTGAIGRAVARRLLGAGWQVCLTGRDPTHAPAELVAAGVAFRAAERSDDAALRAVLEEGADLLVDCACFTARDARLLLQYLREVSTTVMISSKAVYVDAAGRHANSDDPPCFDGPIPESQPTLAPVVAGDFRTREGYGACKVAAEQVLLDSAHPVTVLRPSKVHGAGARRPREWVFVKRVLDRRPVVVLTRRGEGVDHPSAAANVASLVELVAARPGARILNVADPDAPCALVIARTVAAHLGHLWEEILLDGQGRLGAHPWDAVPPLVLDTSAARALGWEPVGEYAATVTEELDWLVAAAAGGADAGLVPRPDDPFFAAYLDYAAEDAYLSSRP